MEFKSICFLAIKNLWSSKLRSLLTMIGIIAGIASVIAIVSIMQAMSNDITQQFENLGTTQLTITPKIDGKSRHIEIENIEKIVYENSNEISKSAPLWSCDDAVVKMSGKTLETSVIATNENYDDITNRKVHRGRFFSYMDLKEKYNICLIGSHIAKKRFDNKEVLGKTVVIDNTIYKIIGILQEIEEGEKWSQDDMIIIPYTSIDSKSDNITKEYIVNSTSTENVILAQSILHNELYKFYKSADMFFLSTMQEEIEAQRSIIDLLTKVLIGVAAISLFVGGIGIMNIMLVSVSERIHEIGIRMAIGASPKNILNQFIIEAATISLVGGCLGIIIGIIVAIGILVIMELKITFSIVSIIISIVISVAIGILFGYLPANKAAKLLPIDALKYD